MKIFISFITFFIFLTVVACSSEEPTSGTTHYDGMVVNTQTNQPYAGIQVKVTDGSQAVVNTVTDSKGSFSFSVDWIRITGNYKLEIGNNDTEKKSLKLIGVSQKEVHLGQIFLSPQDIPSISFEEIKLESNTIHLSAKIDYDGFSEIYEVGFCYSNSESPTLKDMTINADIYENIFHSEISEIILDANTTYYFRPYAKNHIGIGYGSVRSLVTTNASPVVDWYPSAYRAPGSDYIPGLVLHLISNGGCEVDDVGFCWNTSGNPTISDDHKSIGGMDPGTNNGPWPVTISNLKPNTTYYVRPYAKNIRNGIGYGKIKTYTTNK